MGSSFFGPEFRGFRRAYPAPPRQPPPRGVSLDPTSPAGPGDWRGLVFGDTTLPIPAPAQPQPRITKEDLESNRQGGEAQGGGLPGTDDEPVNEPVTGFVGPLPPPPHIRYALPFDPSQGPPAETIGPMHSYIPDETTDVADILAGGDWGRKHGGFMGVEPNVGGGAFSPSQPWENLSPETRAQFPSYWEGQRQLAAERAAKLEEARMGADEARLAKLAEDPMWEESQKADIWARAQGKAQFAIWEELNKRRNEDIARIEAEVLAMDNLSPAQKKQEFETRVRDNDTVKGYSMFLNSTKLPTLSGFPNLSAGASKGIGPTTPTKRT